jgi:hypothetical protein
MSSTLPPATNGALTLAFSYLLRPKLLMSFLLLDTEFLNILKLNLVLKYSLPAFNSFSLAIKTFFLK